MAKLLLLRRKEWLYRNDCKILDVSTLQARYTRTQKPVSPLHPLFPQQKVEVQRHQYKNCASAPGPVADGKQYKAQGLGSFLGVISASGELFGCHLGIKIQCKLWNGSNWWRGWWQCWGLDGQFQPNFTKLFAEYLKFWIFGAWGLSQKHSLLHPLSPIHNDLPPRIACLW